MSIAPLDQPSSEGGRYVQNAIAIDDAGETVYLRSVHVHDFRSYTSKDGKQSWDVDGGSFYLKRSWTPGAEGSYTDWSIKDTDPFSVACERALWGTRGRDGTEALKVIPLAKCTLDHLEAILATQTQLSPLYTRVVKHLIKVKRAEAKVWKATQRKSGRDKP